MSLDLDQVKREIETALASHSFAVYRGVSRFFQEDRYLLWDSRRHPDFQDFLNVAQKLAIKLLVFHHREFNADALQDAQTRLDAAEMPSGERRSLERRLRELRMYEGFTCAIELSFDFENATYVFEVRTEWYSQFLDLLDEIDSYLPEEDSDEEEDQAGGYFSRN